MYETVESKIERDIYLSLEPMTYEEFVNRVQEIFEGDPTVVEEVEKYKQYFNYYISPLTGRRIDIT